MNGQCLNLAMKMEPYQIWKYRILVPSHFIQSSLHFLSHFIPKGKMVTSYQALHTSALHTMRHFIPKPFHTNVLHTKVTSYQCTSYQSQISHFIPMHCIPAHFILVISCRSFAKISRSFAENERLFI